jgi:hypothetical protein
MLGADLVRAIGASVLRCAVEACLQSGCGPGSVRQRIHRRTVARGNDTLGPGERHRERVLAVERYPDCVAIRRSHGQRSVSGQDSYRLVAGDQTRLFEPEKPPCPEEQISLELNGIITVVPREFSRNPAMPSHRSTV